MNNINNSSLLATFKNAIQSFESEGKKIEGIYDLVIRGSALKQDIILIKNYSDLDTSIIVEEINAKTLDQIRLLYQRIKLHFPYKLSITVVSKRDYLHTPHYHGIKPLYYSYFLEASISLLQGKMAKCALLDSDALQSDCYSNVAYLVHDIRTRYLTLDLNNEKDIQDYFCHLVKRTKHIIRNMIFIITGHKDEDINPELFKHCLPEIDPSFPAHLKDYRSNFEKIMSSENIVNHIAKVLTIVEESYAYFLHHYPMHKEEPL